MWWRVVMLRVKEEKVDAGIVVKDLLSRMPEPSVKDNRLGAHLPGTYLWEYPGCGRTPVLCL